jgi:predicted DCC family thiol-disulfide oxidoreductase YuxK
VTTLLPPDADLVLYDGVCGFCDGLVRWLLARDREQRLRFAPLQGAAAVELRERHPEIPESIDTFVFVEIRGGSEQVFVRSAALLCLLDRLPAPWRWLAVLRVVPRGIADLAYDAFARRRYRWFGVLDVCPVPPPEVRERFLD